MVALEPCGEAYLFLDGTAADRDRIAAKLMELGVTVVRAGPNASDYPGDWFLRLTGVDANRKAEIAALLSRAAPAPRPAETGVREALLSQALRSALQRQAELAARIHEATAAGAEERAHSATLLEDIAALRAQIGALPEPPLPPNPPRPTSRAARQLRDELGSVVATLLPRLRLLGCSIDFMATELTDRAPAWRALGELDRHTQGMPLGWKAVAGKQGWWERHFATGHDNQGRLYAHRKAGSWDVLVSHKQGQAADIRNMA